MTRRIAVVTVSRSDWGHLLPVLEEIRRAPDLELCLLVTGMHLSSDFGLTVAAIEADGWPIAERVPMLDADDSPEGIAAAVGRGVAGLAAAYARRRPDLVVVLGDRFEMLAAAVAALPFALPVAHIHGGEESQGAIDNQIRHAITKLAHVHFASAALHAERLAGLGEEPWRIHAVGAPGLDRLRGLSYLDRAAIAGALRLDPARPWVLVTFHPVTLEYRDTAEQATELLAALEKTDGEMILTYPNADTAGRVIIEHLEDWAARHPQARLSRSLGEQMYCSLLREAAVMVGNSSSGLIEAPSFALPVVNIGSRQRGRLRGANVIDVAPTRGDIRRGIETALGPGFREALRGMPNPYGDGTAAPRIAAILRRLALDARLIEKRFPEGGSA
jgi:UDP-hydrolysing UDP-N-acetyl-D-glucosamine 2-epimerase